MPLVNAFRIALLATAVCLLAPAWAAAQAIISNGTVQLGVNRDGSLNVGGGPPSSGGVTVVGLRYLPTNAESTAPGCTCEGWGLGDEISGIWGGANTAFYGAVGRNITLQPFSADSSTALSVVTVGGIFRITHVYRPSPNQNLYQVDVTIENISGGVRKPVYRRAMDWDIEPTPFSEMVTIRTRGAEGTVPAALRYASTNGFADSNPFSRPPTYTTVYDRVFGSSAVGDIVDLGPRDHGAVFDFDFAELAPGEKLTFKTFYGAAGNEEDALSALTTVGAELYTLGQASRNPGTGYGTPNTFMFGFTGVGGAPVGDAVTTTTDVSSNINPALLGTPITFTSVVTAASGNPEPVGTVQFRLGITVLATVPLTPAAGTSTSSAVFTTSTLPAGTHAITAAYSGGTQGAGASLVTFRTSESPVLPQEVVSKRQTSLGIAFGSASIPEGGTTLIVLTVSDVDGGSPITPTGFVSVSSSVATDSLGPGCTLNSTSAGMASCSLPIRALDDGVREIRASFPESESHFGNAAGASLSAHNVAPVIHTISGPSSPVPVGTSTTISASFGDVGVLDTHSCSISWDVEVAAGAVTESGGSGSCSGSRTYTAAGVYTVTVTVTDDDGGSGASIFQYIVVYDPNAGFVTGGGWIDSPAGAYAADITLSGKANFGFVSKYKKGMTVPTGETQFQFHVANFSFHSTAYEWLVVSGPKAQYKGRGMVNGSGDYGFLLTATDGQVSGGGGIDKFRIKIWDAITNQVVYDNVPGAGDDMDAASPQTIGGGSIVIHNKK